MSFDPKAYAVGDVIKVTQTFKVAALERLGINVVDVKSGEDVFFWPSDDTMRVEMVKRAARPKPKAGDVLTGAEIGKIQWKSGTVIRCTRTKGLTPLVLFADGKWHDTDGFSGYEFDDLAPGTGFEILLVA